MLSENHRSTSRVLDILEILASSDNGYTLTEIADSIGAPKSSIFPIIHTLSNRNYIEINKDTSKYTIGINTFALGFSFLENRNIFNYITKEMTTIVNKCHETCQLGILDRSDVLYIAKVDSPEPIRMISHVGKRLPASCTSLGKALLCDFSKEKLKSLYPKGLKKFTKNTVSDFDMLFRQLEEVHITGFASEYQETTEHIQCISIPLRKYGTIVASISVAIPTFRSSEEKIQLIKKLLLVAQTNIQTLMEELNADLSAQTRIYE